MEHPCTLSKLIDGVTNNDAESSCECTASKSNEEVNGIMASSSLQD
jgi:hypothetical protein